MPEGGQKPDSFQGSPDTGQDVKGHKLKYKVSCLNRGEKPKQQNHSTKPPTNHQTNPQLFYCEDGKTLDQKLCGVSIPRHIQNLAEHSSRQPATVINV